MTSDRISTAASALRSSLVSDGTGSALDAIQEERSQSMFVNPSAASSFVEEMKAGPPAEVKIQEGRRGISGILSRKSQTQELYEASLQLRLGVLRTSTDEKSKKILELQARLGQLT